MPKPTFEEIFGAYLRHLRKAMGLNQVAFAKRLNISQSQLSGLELGDRMPSGPAINAIIDALGIDVRSLLRGMEEVARGRDDKRPGVSTGHAARGAPAGHASKGER